MDEILINQLAVSCIIGVNDWERRSAQQLLISITLHTSVNPAATTDSLENTVDYATACELVQQIACKGRFRLIETLAEQLAQALLAQNPVERVDVEVLKPGAIRNAQSVGVRIRRPASTAAANRAHDN